MKHEEYYADDRIIIPDYIEKMSDEELDAFIAEREAEAVRQKQLRTSAIAAKPRATA